jgi:hypothetical protein
MASDGTKNNLVKLNPELSREERVMAAVAGLTPDGVYFVSGFRQTSLGKLYVLFRAYRLDGDYVRSTTKFANVPERYVAEFIQDLPS